MDKKNEVTQDLRLENQKEVLLVLLAYELLEHSLMAQVLEELVVLLMALLVLSMAQVLEELLDLLEELLDMFEELLGSQ